MFPIYPYLNINDLNLDYVLKQIGILETEVTQFVSLNAIKYADPIQWNIVQQYEKNTVVIDPLTGTAYISVAPVPSGVALTNTDYWTVVFDLGSFVTRAAQNFTSKWESETTLTATFPTAMGGWLVWGDVLYKALTNITAGDSYVVNGNIEHFTIEDLYNAYLNTIANILAMVGDLADLTTTDKTSIVDAINEVVGAINAVDGNLTQEITDRGNADNALDVKIGDLATLTTTDKSSAVAAINELDSDLDDLAAELHALYKDTVADLALGTYNGGEYIRTGGYYAISDGGGALYKIINESNLSPSNATLNDGKIHFSATQSAQLVLSDYAFAKQFGAVGDGVADDTAALQALVTFCGNNNITAYINNGSYHTTASINVTKLVFIKGETFGSSKFINQFSTGVFNITSTNGAWFFDLLFIFNVSTTSSDCAFYANNAFGINLNNIEQIGQSYGGATEGKLIKAVGTTHNIIMENVFSDCGGSTYAFDFDLTYNGAASDIVMRNCFCDNYLGKLVNMNNVSDFVAVNCIFRCKNTIYTARNTSAPWCFITNSCNTLDSLTDSSVIYDIGDKCSILDNSTFADRNNTMNMTGASFYYTQHDTGYVISPSLDLFTPLNSAGYGLRSRTFNPFWTFTTAADDTIKGAFYVGDNKYNEINLDVMGVQTGLRYGIALRDSNDSTHFLALLYAPSYGTIAVADYLAGVETILYAWTAWDVAGHQFSAVRDRSLATWTLLVGNGRGVYQPIFTSNSFDINAKVGFIEISNNANGMATIVDLIDARFLGT